MEHPKTALSLFLFLFLIVPQWKREKTKQNAVTYNGWDKTDEDSMSVCNLGTMPQLSLQFIHHKLKMEEVQLKALALFSQRKNRSVWSQNSWLFTWKHSQMMKTQAPCCFVWVILGGFSFFCFLKIRLMKVIVSFLTRQSCNQSFCSVDTLAQILHQKL